MTETTYLREPAGTTAARRTVISRPADRHRAKRVPTVVRAGSTNIDTVIVAIPARNEAENIERCLTSIDHAARHVDRRVVIVVAADSCRDDTATVARLTGALLRTEVHVTEGTWRAAGRARAAAVSAAIALADADASTIWIANTDADCIAPPDWLARHLAHATRGAHAVAGIVDLDPTSTKPALLAQFRATYMLTGATHTHIHGANLGVRADAYRAVGGWGLHVLVGEDHELVRRLTTAGLNVTRATDTVSVTSSRTIGRMPAGFAHRLAQLADPARPPRRSRRMTLTKYV